MSMATETKKSKTGLKIFIVIIVILGLLGLAFKFVIYDKLKEKAFNMVTKDAFFCFDLNITGKWHI